MTHNIHVVVNAELYKRVGRGPIIAVWAWVRVDESRFQVVLVDDLVVLGLDQGNVRLELFQSPIQHFGITPNNLEEQPTYVIDFLKTVPAAWDDTRYVDGYPGRSAVLARRSGEVWYVAATHAARESKEMMISLPWLKGKSVDLFYDKEDRSAGLRQTLVGEDGTITLSLAAGGGAVLVYQP